MLRALRSVRLEVSYFGTTLTYGGTEVLHGLLYCGESGHIVSFHLSILDTNLDGPPEEVYARVSGEVIPRPSAIGVDGVGEQCRDDVEAVKILHIPLVGLHEMDAHAPLSE